MPGHGTCVVVGAGSGNGLAFSRRFGKAGYRVAMLAREEESLRKLVKDVPGSVAIPCDVTNPVSVTAAFDAVRERLDEPDVLIYNAGSGKFGPVDEITATDFESAWRVNAYGCLLCLQAVLAGMHERGSGHIIIIGATASRRGGANFAAFAPAKAAQRSLAETAARRLGPDGIHVAYVVIDGVIDSPRTRSFFPDKQDDFFLRSADIAESVYLLTTQPKSAWTFELDLRPFREKW